MQMKFLKIGLHHTKFCAHHVRGAQIVQTISQRVKPETGKFLALEYMYYL